MYGSICRKKRNNRNRKPETKTEIIVSVDCSLSSDYRIINQKKLSTFFRYSSDLIDTQAMTKKVMKYHFKLINSKAIIFYWLKKIDFRLWVQFWIWLSDIVIITIKNWKMISPNDWWTFENPLWMFKTFKIHQMKIAESP